MYISFMSLHILELLVKVMGSSNINVYAFSVLAQWKSNFHIDWASQNHKLFSVTFPSLLVLIPDREGKVTQGIFSPAWFLFHKYLSTQPGLKAWKLWLSSFLWCLPSADMGLISHTVYHKKGYFCDCAEVATTNHLSTFLRQKIIPFRIPFTRNPYLKFWSEKKKN